MVTNKDENGEDGMVVKKVKDELDEGLRQP